MTNMNRRDFLRTTAMGGAGLLVSLSGCPALSWAFSQSLALRKFIQPLPGLGPQGIPVASPITDPLFPNCDYYEILMGEFRQQLHPQLPPTKLWGYADVTGGKAPNFRHLGGVIVAQKGRPVRLRATNMLPNAHPLPVDTTIMGAEPDQLVNRATLHLHGGHVPWTSDGVPHSWFAPAADGGARGPSLVGLPDRPPFNAPPGSWDYYFPNDQSSRFMMYHDHALGITRLNAYAGLASAYLLRDDIEKSLTSTPVVSNLIPWREVPLIIQDKVFKSGNPAFVDQYPQYELPVGDLWYPYLYEKEMWETRLGAHPPVPSVVPDFFGDTMLVNGVVYPTVTLEPTRYRLRVLNVCNSRFCTLRLVYPQGTTFPYNAEPALNASGGPSRPGPGFIQIGSEGGFLDGGRNPRGVRFEGTTPASTLLLSPGERADLIVDFSGLEPGTTLLLYNDAPAPFPMADRRNDYFPGSIGNPVVSKPGYGPDTRTLMQIVIGPLVGPADPDRGVGVLPSMDPPPLAGAPWISTAIPAGLPVRRLCLTEAFDHHGRLEQLMGPGGTGLTFDEPPTETPTAGSTEIWQIFNKTADAHPIHFHLVNIQLISRTPNGGCGTPQLPNANEMGWKETVRINPAEMVTIMIKFDLPTVPFPIPLSPRTGGHEYVWHCHMLEHEEHDMMRPLIIQEQQKRKSR